MRQGMTLQELAAEVDRQQNTRRDFVARTNAVELVHVESESGPGEVVLGLPDQGVFGVNDLAHRQIGGHVGIPATYYDRMRRAEPKLLVENVNTWMKREPSDQRRMVRTLDRTARAFLSDSYRPLDNAALLEAILPVFADQRVEIQSSNLSDERLHLQVLFTNLDPIEVKVGDPVRAGLLVRNSEVGSGALALEWLIWRLICRNGAVMGSPFRKAHVGRGRIAEFDGDEMAVLYSDGTKRLDDAAFFAKVSDAVRHFSDRAAFERQVEKLQVAAGQKIEVTAVEACVEKVSKRVGLSEGERKSVLGHLIEGGDLSKWGLANAVTRLAHDAESYDHAIELERAGAQVIELSRSDWKVVAEAA